MLLREIGTALVTTTLAANSEVSCNPGKAGVVAVAVIDCPTWSVVFTLQLPVAPTVTLVIKVCPSPCPWSSASLVARYSSTIQPIQAEPVPCVIVAREMTGQGVLSLVPPCDGPPHSTSPTG